MLIKKKFLREINNNDRNKTYMDGYRWFINNFPRGAESDEVFKRATADGYFDYFASAILQHLSREKKIEFAIWCAEKVLPIFESQYKNDNRPRAAIESAKNYLKNPCERKNASVSDEIFKSAKRAMSAAYVARHDKAYTAYSAASAAAYSAQSASLAAMYIPDNSSIVFNVCLKYAAMKYTLSSKVNPALSMQILQKGFEIFERAIFW